MIPLRGSDFVGEVARLFSGESPPTPPPLGEQCCQLNSAHIQSLPHRGRWHGEAVTEGVDKLGTSGFSLSYDAFGSYGAFGSYDAFGSYGAFGSYDASQ